MYKIPHVCLLALITSMVACSDDSSETKADAAIQPAPDATVTVADAAPGPDAMPEVTVDCPPVADFPNFQPTAAQIGTADPTSRFILFPLPEPDGMPIPPNGPTNNLVTYIDGTIAPGLALGTFPLEGVQITADCDHCILVEAGAGALFYYVAQSGTMTVSSVFGSYAGSFQPAPGDTTTTFSGFQINPDDSVTAVPECTVQGGAFSWNLPVPFQQP